MGVKARWIGVRKLIPYDRDTPLQQLFHPNRIGVSQAGGLEIHNDLFVRLFGS